jgi:putative membrane protein
MINTDFKTTKKSKPTLTKQSLMNTTTESKRSVEHYKTRFPRLIAGSASKVGMALMAVGLLFAIPCAKAETTISMADTNFILAAAQGGMTEVELGELAATNGMRDDVKNFGQMMVKDHTAINDDLKALASQKGVTLPDSLDANHQAMVDKLTALTGSEFDDAYIAAMIKGHKKDAKAFKAEAAATTDTDIKSFLDKSIPVVEAHLQHITAMKK